MASYIITFDLNNPGQRYTQINDAIKSIGSWAKIATTTFVVTSNLAATEIRDSIWAKMDKNDELFVGKLTGEAAWNGLSNSLSKWLKENL